MEQEDSPWFQLGQRLAETVFAPDYYDGPWYVQFYMDGRRYWRNCPSYASAQMWARYVRRRYRDRTYQDGVWHRVDISIGKGRTEKNRPT